MRRCRGFTLELLQSVGKNTHTHPHPPHPKWKSLLLQVVSKYSRSPISRSIYWWVRLQRSENYHWTTISRDHLPRDFWRILLTFSTSPTYERNLKKPDWRRVLLSATERRDPVRENGWPSPSWRIRWDQWRGTKRWPRRPVGKRTSDKVHSR